MGGFAGFTKGFTGVIEPKLEANRQKKDAQDAELRKYWLGVALSMDDKTPDAIRQQAEKELGKLYGDKESKSIIQRAAGMVGKIRGKIHGGQQASPAGAVPPMQQNGKQSGSDAMGAETGGVPQGAPQAAPQGQPMNGVPPRQQTQASPGAVPPRPQAPPEMGRGQAMVAGAREMNAADQRRTQALDTAKTDEAIRKETATAADRLSLQETKDKALKDIEEQKARHAKELLTLKDADQKTIQEMKDKQAKEIEALKAQHAKELFNAREAHRAALKTGSGGGAAKESVPKTYTPGGKSVHNPTGDLTIDIGAWDYINTGHLPFTGFSGGAKETKNARELMLGRAGELLADAGLTPADLPAIRGKIKGDTSALAKVSTMGAMVKQFEGTLSRNMETAKKLSEAWDRHDLRFLNRIEAAYKTGVGDSEALNLAAQLHGIAREWGKIMSGSTSAAGVQVSEANATDEFFNKGISNGQLLSFMENVIVPDIRNRTAAIDEEKSNLVQSIRGAMGDMASPGSATKAQPANGVPARGDKKKKVWNEKDQKFE